MPRARAALRPTGAGARACRMLPGVSWWGAFVIRCPLSSFSRGAPVPSGFASASQGIRSPCPRGVPTSFLHWLSPVFTGSRPRGPLPACRWLPAVCQFPPPAASRLLIRRRSLAPAPPAPFRTQTPPALPRFPSPLAAFAQVVVFAKESPAGRRRAGAQGPCSPSMPAALLAVARTANSPEGLGAQEILILPVRRAWPADHARPRLPGGACHPQGHAVPATPGAYLTTTARDSAAPSL